MINSIVNNASGMTPGTYINEQFHALSSYNSPIILESLEQTIYTLLLSKKFRKYSVNLEYLPHITSAIHQNVIRHDPIKLTLVFGGYKLWRLPEAPEPDWAEVFALMYYTHWLRPICAIYTPGVWLDFYSDDVILEYMDHIPKKDTEQYIKQFRNLLEFMKTFMPKNLHFSLHRVGDQYASREDFLHELEANKKIVEKKFGGLPVLTDEQRRLVELNVKPTLQEKEDPKWHERVYLIHEAYAMLSKRRPYYRTPDKIFIITKKINDSIAVGTTKTSIVKYWIGAGVLEKKCGSFIQHIFSPNQLERRPTEKKAIKITGLDGKNFQSIRVLV